MHLDMVILSIANLI